MFQYAAPPNVEVTTVNVTGYISVRTSEACVHDCVDQTTVIMRTVIGECGYTYVAAAFVSL